MPFCGRFFCLVLIWFNHCSTRRSSSLALLWSSSNNLITIIVALLAEEQERLEFSRLPTKIGVRSGVEDCLFCWFNELTNCGTVSKATVGLGGRVRDKVDHIIMGFPELIDTILNRTELLLHGAQDRDCFCPYRLSSHFLIIKQLAGINTIGS